MNNAQRFSKMPNKTTNWLSAAHVTVGEDLRKVIVFLCLPGLEVVDGKWCTSMEELTRGLHWLQYYLVHHLHLKQTVSLEWRHDEPDSVSNHQPDDCLRDRLFRHRSKKTSKLRVTGLCAGNSPGPVNSPHKWPVTRKMFPFDDVIM